MRFKQLEQMFLHNQSHTLCKTFCNKTSFMALNGQIRASLDPADFAGGESPNFMYDF